MNATGNTKKNRHRRVHVASGRKRLRKIFLGVHPLCWLDLEPQDLERGSPMAEHWPGRAELCRQRDEQMQAGIERLVRGAGADEGIFILPTRRKGADWLIELARECLGPRCIVARCEGGMEQIQQVLGREFVQRLDEDRAEAAANRGPCFSEGPMSCTRQIEWDAWVNAKAWAEDLVRQLDERGYAMDPHDVEFVVFGENWVGCTASFPCGMARALGLSKSMERRFELINPDWSPILLKATIVEQNVPMPDHVRLFLWKTADEYPTWGRHIAQYWEGIHGIMDPPHTVVAEFPEGTVSEIDLFLEVGLARGLVGPKYERHGRMTMHVGCGAHTPYHSTIAMAEESLPLDAFLAALLSGQVVQNHES